MLIPKAELHVHLEGTIRPELAKSLAQRNKLSFPEEIIDKDGESYRYQDFMDFLKIYDTVAAVIKHPRDYYDLTFDYLAESARGGSIYVEMMYSPDHAEKSSGISSKDHLEAIQQAIDDAEAKYQIRGRILITAVRHFGAEAAINVANQALKAKVPCIVGFGLGGDEINFPPKLFKKAYNIMAEAGLECTVHAGEFASHEGMIEAMDSLPIQRIGHGVMSIHSPETIARLVDKNIALEVCPSSNIVLGLFSNLEEHPFMSLKKAGVKVSLNSDDPPFFKTTLEKEYVKVQEFYKQNDEQMRDITRMAITSAFVDEKTKAKLLERVNEFSKS